MSQDTPRIEYLSLGSLKQFPGNPKKHDIPKIQHSIRTFGFKAPLLMDETTGFIVAGHGRIEALQGMQAGNEERPREILQADGDWLVPVVRGLHFKDEAEAEAYLLADNQTTIAGGWDSEALGKILSKMTPNLQGVTGFSSFEIKGLISRITLRGEETQPTPDPPEAPVSRRGEIWQLGDHRVMCGDTTLQQDVDRLMAGNKAAVVITDPPYGVFYDNTVHFAKNLITGVEDHHDKDWGEVQGDQSVEVALKALPIIFQNIQDNGSVYICSGTKLAVAIVNWLDANHIKYSPFLIWLKTHIVPTWQRYHNKHELILYCGPGSGPTHGSRWFGPNNEETVWEMPQALGPDRVHPTQKPVELYERALRNSTTRNEIILDPFLGAGTAIIAAERMGRICMGMDIEPKYCDVAIQRWENYVGKKAQLVE